jgi:hypothetical protein
MDGKNRIWALHISIESDILVNSYPFPHEKAKSLKIESGARGSRYKYSNFEL